MHCTTKETASSFVLLATHAKMFEVVFLPAKPLTHTSCHICDKPLPGPYLTHLEVLSGNRISPVDSVEW